MGELCSASTKSGLYLVDGESDVGKERLTLNLQDYHFDKESNSTWIGVNYIGQCAKINTDAYQVTLVSAHIRPVPGSSQSSYEHYIAYKSEGPEEGDYYQVTATDEYGSICSDSASQITLYHIERKGA